MTMYFCPLFSGSSGNALFAQYGTTRLLIDAGRSCSQLEEALNSIGVDPASLNALLVTHEHSDHIAGISVIARRYHLPVYATAGTWQAMEAKVKYAEHIERVIISPDEDFYLGDMGIMPFAIPHDAADPVGFRLWGGTVSVSTATDLGHYTKGIGERIAGSSLVLLESNHDQEMVKRNPHYPAYLKKRILGNHGHLCNEACASAAVELVRSGVKHLILGHLSGENNTPELAYQVTAAQAEAEGVRLGEDLTLDVATRSANSMVYRLDDGGIP